MSHYALPLFALLAISGCLELPGTTEPESTDPADTATPAGCGAADPSVLSTTGCIEGSSAGTIESFLGVPYAEPPVGDLRFKKTVPIAAWSGPLDAGEVGPMCVQGENPLTFDDDAAEGSEDCLTLNVLRPAGTQPADSLPILFFTHGGNFSFGSGGAALLLGDHPGGESQALLAEGAIVVTHNYRLGQLGFVAHPALSAESEDGTSGNYGTYDTIEALRWVNDNAEALGGSSDNIVIFGESAGGLQSCALLVSPLASGLFTGAIMESGFCTYEQPLRGSSPRHAESAEEQGESFAAELGCEGTNEAVLDCFRSASPEEIVAASPSSVSAADLEGERYWPISDGVLIPDASFLMIERGEFNRVPVALGVNRDEGNLHAAALFYWITSWTTLDTTLKTFGWVLGMDQEARATYSAFYSASLYAAPNQAMGQAWTDLGFSCVGRVTARNFAQYVDTRTYFFTKNSELIDAALNSAIGFDLGAFHGAELPYVFGTVENHPSYDTSDAAVSRSMTQIWTSASEGAWTLPSGDPWPLYEAKGPWLEIGASGVTPLEDDDALRNAGFNVEVCDFLEGQGVWEE